MTQQTVELNTRLGVQLDLVGRLLDDLVGEINHTREHTRNSPNHGDADLRVGNVSKMLGQSGRDW